jgi:hypothetical protein
MELLTAKKKPEDRRSFRWGVCKKPGCKGTWWKPDGFKGWMRLQVPTAPKKQEDEPLDETTAEDFEP